MWRYVVVTGAKDYFEEVLLLVPSLLFLDGKGLLYLSLVMIDGYVLNVVLEELRITNPHAVFSWIGQSVRTRQQCKQLLLQCKLTEDAINYKPPIATIDLWIKKEMLSEKTEDALYEKLKMMLRRETQEVRNSLH